MGAYHVYTEKSIYSIFLTHSQKSYSVIALKKECERRNSPRFPVKMYKCIPISQITTRLIYQTFLL